MTKYKSNDYKLSAVKYYLKHNDSMDKVCEIFNCKINNTERPSYLCREIKSNQSASTSTYNQTLHGYEKT
uniref:Uncharacterized protein n=1 Tax=viral metagenome TaxID=1070528 RepID=A0A6C0ATG7_9ZZZZ